MQAAPTPSAVTPIAARIVLYGSRQLVNGNGTPGLRAFSVTRVALPPQALQLRHQMSRNTD
jgi:hypothetical protein